MDNRCYMVSDGDEHVGYFRKKANADEAAERCVDPHVEQIEPPDPIVCDDDIVQ